MFRMPFTEQLDLMRNALGAIHRRIPQVEEIFKGAADRNATSSVPSARGVRKREARDATSKQGKNLPGPGVEIP
jgi:hypothetical protein